MRPTAAVLTIILISVPMASSTPSRPAFEFDVDIDGTGRLGTVLNLDVDIKSNVVWENVHLELLTPSALSKSPEVYVLDFEKGQVRTLRWTTSPQQWGFWAAQVLVTVQSESANHDAGPQTISEVGATVYGFTHPTQSAVATDPADIMPRHASASLNLSWEPDLDGHFTLRASAASTTEWMRYAQLHGSLNVFNLSSTREVRGYEPLILELDYRLSPATGASGHVAIRSIPAFDAVRNVTEGASVLAACSGLFVGYSDPHSLYLDQDLPCPFAHEAFPVPNAAATWNLIALVSLVALARCLTRQRLQ